MTLAQFEKINLATKTTYIVYEGDYIRETFEVDYIKGSNEDFRFALNKRQELEKLGARVTTIAPAPDDGRPALEVRVQIKKKGGTK